MNRLISHGQAILSTLAFSLVIHFMPLAPSVLPDGNLGQATGLAARASRAAPPGRTSGPCQPGYFRVPAGPGEVPAGSSVPPAGLTLLADPRGSRRAPRPRAGPKPALT